MRIALCFLIALAVPVASAQHGDHASHAASSADVPSGLTAAEVEGLLAGAGMGMAKPAELNAFPGPLHVLELAEDLALTEAQQVETERIRARMLEETRGLGAQLVEVERHLDSAFEGGEVTPEAVDRMTAHAARLRGQIRASHLKAHLDLRPVLTDAQVDRYNELRGYTPPSDR